MKQAEKRKLPKFTTLVCLMSALVLIGAGIGLFYVQRNYIMLQGEDTIKIGLNGTYKEQGAVAFKSGKDVSDKVKIKGELDTGRPGAYVLTYSYGKMEAERQVIVDNKMNPELTLEGKKKATLKLGEPYEQLSYQAVDRTGKNISDRVSVGKVNLNKTGLYRIPYSVDDRSGNSTTIYHEVKVEANTEYETPGLPICMYHYVYDEDNPPEDLYHRYGNYIEAGELEKELTYLKENDYYFPSWQEVRDYVDGELLLPEKSIVLCFDDGEKSFLKNGIPVIEKCQVPVTSFLITKNDGEKKVNQYKSKYVGYQTHSDNMHRDGGLIGKGGIITALSEEEIIADLKKSIEICGNDDVFAYPYGDYTEDSRDAVENAGLLCAVTTDGGKVYPGEDPYLLPRIRMFQDQTLESFIYKIN